MTIEMRDRGADTTTEPEILETEETFFNIRVRFKGGLLLAEGEIIGIASSSRILHGTAKQAVSTESDFDPASFYANSLADNALPIDGEDINNRPDIGRQIGKQFTYIPDPIVVG